MNPLIQKYAVAALRHALGFLGAYLVSLGMEEGATTELISGLSAALVTIAWSLYEKNKDKIKLNTAMAVPHPVSEKQLDAIIADPAISIPPADIPVTKVPYIKNVQP